MISLSLSIQLRRAGIQDLPQLLEWIREPENPFHDSLDPDDDWDWESELQRTPEWREFLIAELNGRAIGFIQIIDPAKEESHYWGNVPDKLRAVDIWIGEKKDMSKGHGTAMMKLATERCFAHEKVTAILIDPLRSNTRAIRFYKRLGFKFVEDRFFGTDYCSVHKLEKEDWLKRKQ